MFLLLVALTAPTFYRDVVPILQQRCQVCHHPGGVAPMPLTTYRETRPWAKAIREAVLTRKMPPWPADPKFGRFANDPSLSVSQVRTLCDWASAGGPAGDPHDGPSPPAQTAGWRIGAPDAVVEMTRPFQVPAATTVEYQYFVLPTGFSEDRWLRAVEVRPGNTALVHHAVVYVREPGSEWLKEARPGEAFSFPSRSDHLPDPRSLTRSDILLVYTPGNSADSWPAGLAKKIPAGSDLVLQMHYTAGTSEAEDRTRIGMTFTQAPEKRVLTLQLGNDRLAIPPGEPNYRVQASGTLPGDALLLALFPHMHLRGKAFEYLVQEPGGPPEVLLRIPRFDFFWQLNYRLATPRRLKAGTRLTCTAWYDNSPNNRRNPDPAAEVRFGEQSWDEMMIGFFDIAVDAQTDKFRFFQQRSQEPGARSQ